MRQQGSQAAKASTQQAAEQAAKEGSAVGLLKVVLKEHDHDNVQMLQLAAKPLMLQELKVGLDPGLGTHSISSHMLSQPVCIDHSDTCSTTRGADSAMP